LGLYGIVTLKSLLRFSRIDSSAMQRRFAAARFRSSGTINLLVRMIYAAPLDIALGGSLKAQQPEFRLHDGNRVFFYGDSVTDQRNYTQQTELFVLTRYPKMHVRFSNSGWGEDRVSGGGIDLRLQRDVTAYKPTVVTIMLGMNDGGYRPATEAYDKTFFDGYRHICDVLKQNDPQARTTTIESSPYDDVTRPTTFPVLGVAPCNQSLVGYAKWIGPFAQERTGLSPTQTPTLCTCSNAPMKLALNWRRRSFQITLILHLAEAS
jgi:lysophospholipase L1-like esterase